jgi:hypothetical protein
MVRVEEKIMASLRDAVRSEIDGAVGREAVDQWSIDSDGPDSCTARTPIALLRFSIDRRDGLITSSVTFLDPEEKFREELFSHIVTKIFPSTIWQTTALTDSFTEKVRAEVKNVTKILDLVKTGQFNPRDLFYFYIGYNTGYTDSVTN